MRENFGIPYDDLSALLPPEPLKVFFGYAHKDRAFRDQLTKHLIPFVRENFVTPWSDGDIIAGTEWAEEIYHHLNTADLILLLISPDFIHSEFCYHIVMNQAIKRHSSKDARAIPILLRPTYWDMTPLRILQPLPKGGKPISNWSRREDAYFDIVSSILEEIKLLQSERWVEKSDVFNETKRYDYALNACEKAILLNPKNVSAYLSKGSLLWHLNRYEEALTVYKQISHIDPKNTLALLSLAYAFLTLGRYQAALQACEQLIGFDPENVVAHLFMGYLYGRLRDHAYQKAKQIDYERWREQLNNKYLIIKPDNLSPFFKRRK